MGRIEKDGRGWRRDGRRIGGEWEENRRKIRGG